MIKNDLKIQTLLHGDIVEQLARERMLTLEEARDLVSKMSFKDYRNFLEATLQQPTNSFSTIKPTYPNPAQVKQTPEVPDDDEQDRLSDPQLKQEDITPPSGQTIGPNSQSNGANNPSQSNQPTAAPGSSSSWPGKGTPPQVGMTVGLKGPNGVPVPGQISQVDISAKGVKVKNPTTGQDEWTNIDALQPFMAQNNQQQGQNNQSNQQNMQQSQQQAMEDANDLQRLRELAGIKENCSAGATGSGSIAIAPVAVGNTIKRRPPAEESQKKEYEPRDSAKTIIGDTKPNQASGELSANLAVRGKKTASRTNNGFKR